MKSSSRFKNLREYVNAQPRTTTQGDIARSLGVSESALSSYLSGSRVPGREAALRIARLTGVPLEALLDPPREAMAS